MLYKAQEEADPLGNVPKKESESQQESMKDGSVKGVTNGESSTASASKKAEDEVSVSVNNPEGAANDGRHIFSCTIFSLYTCCSLILECFSCWIVFNILKSLVLSSCL